MCTIFCYIAKGYLKKSLGYSGFIATDSPSEMLDLVLLKIVPVMSLFTAVQNPLRCLLTLVGTLVFSILKISFVHYRMDVPTLSMFLSPILTVTSVLNTRETGGI